MEAHTRARDEDPRCTTTTRSTPEATTHARPAWPTGPLDTTYRRAKAVLSWTDAAGAHEAVITEPTAVGSAANVPVSIADVAVSRMHFEVAPAADRVWITDLGNRNGTFYEGARVERVCVPDGTRLRVGGTDVRMRHAHEAPDAPLFPAAELGPLVGRSAVMRELFAQLVKIAASDETALIHGETGTGKELIARDPRSLAAQQGAVRRGRLRRAAREPPRRRAVRAHQGGFYGRSSDRTSRRPTASRRAGRARHALRPAAHCVIPSSATRPARCARKELRRCCPH